MWISVYCSYLEGLVTPFQTKFGKRKKKNIGHSVFLFIYIYIYIFITDN